MLVHLKVTGGLRSVLVWHLHGQKHKRYSSIHQIPYSGVVFGAPGIPFGRLGASFGLLYYVGIKYTMLMLTGVWQGKTAMWTSARGKIPNPKNPKHTPSWEIYNLVGRLENKPDVTRLWRPQRHVPSHNLSNPAPRKRELDDDAVPKAHRNSAPLL